MIALKYIFVITTLSCIVFLSQCSNADLEEAHVKKKKSLQRQVYKNLNIHDALPKTVKAPKDNLSSSKKIALGKLLFYDPILSGDKDVACASCHHPLNGYTEYRDLSIGVNGKGLSSKRVFNQPNEIPFVKRNSQTILNTAFNGINTSNQYAPEDAPMFWDVRVKSLEQQALEPILAFEEMRGTHFSKTEILDELVKRLKGIPEYVSLFKDAFNESESIHEKNIGKSIAAFERTLVTSESRFDHYMRGDNNAMSLSEKDGFTAFNRVGCGNCHNGPMLSDYKSHVIGVPANPKLPAFDTGINKAYAFRTASLRNLRFTAPYMHNGKFNSLKEVLEFYEDIKNGKIKHQEVSREQLDPFIKDLELTVKEIGPIISFLNTLNDANFDKEIPKNVPSGLSVGGNID